MPTLPKYTLRQYSTVSVLLMSTDAISPSEESVPYSLIYPAPALWRLSWIPDAPGPQARFGAVCAEEPRASAAALPENPENRMP